MTTFKRKDIMIILHKTPAAKQTERVTKMEELLVVEADALKNNGVATPLKTDDGRPNEEWVRGRCPECGDDLVSNLYYVGGKGYLLVWECWDSLKENPQCEYRRVL